MTKCELLRALTNTWQSFVVGLLLPNLVTEDIWSQLDEKNITFDGPNGPWLRLPSEWYSEVIKNKENRTNVIGEFEKTLKRAMLREGHELILLYCEQTKQTEIYKAVSWFQFARIIRNIVSHKQNSILQIWPRDLTDKGISQVSWRNRTLNASMVGQEISFTHQEAMQLFADQMTFAQSELK